MKYTIYTFCVVIIFSILGVYYALYTDVVDLYSKNRKLEKRFVELEAKYLKLENDFLIHNIGIYTNWSKK